MRVTAGDAVGRGGDHGKCAETELPPAERPLSQRYQNKQTFHPCWKTLTPQMYFTCASGHCRVPGPVGLTTLGPIWA